MIRALLDSDVKLKLLILNQSEETTTSIDLKKRIEDHYQNINLSIEVRRHPDYNKKPSLLSSFSKKYKLPQKIEKLTFKDAVINNRTALPKNFENLINHELNQGAHDFAWFNYMKMKPSKLSANNTKIIIDMHDMQINRIKADVLPTIDKLRQKKYLKVFTESERDGLSRCDIAISISSVETQQIQKFYRPKAEIVTLPATDDVRFVSANNFEYDICFIGSNSAPNINGLLWFLNEVFPTIAETLPNIRFLIQGNINRNKNLKEALKNYRHINKIKQQGFVENLSATYESSKLIICPIRYGTGMKIKVVEGMAHGKALVCTPVALEGITEEFGIRSIRDADTFASECILLATNEQQRHAQEKASRDTFLAGHSYRSLKRMLKTNILDKL